MCNFSLDRTQPRGYLSFPSLAPSLPLPLSQPAWCWINALLPPHLLDIFISSPFIHSSTRGGGGGGGGLSRLPTLSFWTCLKLYGRKQELANKYQGKIEKRWAGMHHQSCVNDEDPPHTRTHTHVHMRAASKQQCTFGALM